ncbi:MAG: hypothetical protein HOY79_44000 [Streptomyces sp.]|nr:hypothetical protein [Streptomyces sp.]
MHWSVYEIFSVISGIILLFLAVALPNIGARDRFWSGIGGLLMIGYGVYVANQTSGTYVFPAGIFVIPVLAFLYLIGAAMGHTGDKNGGSGGPTK